MCGNMFVNIFVLFYTILHITVYEENYETIRAYRIVFIDLL